MVHRERLQRASPPPLCSGECDYGSRHVGGGSTKASHDSSGLAVAAGYGEATTASIGAKGGSFPSFVATGKANDSTVVTKGHGGVRTVESYAAELW